MFYPNGNLTLNQLLNMLYSKEYDIWFEPNDEPKDWDWKKNGFYRSPNKTKITTKEDLLKAIQSEYDKEGKIIFSKLSLVGNNKQYLILPFTNSSAPIYFFI